MAIAKRIALFLLVNLLVVSAISIGLNFLGVQPFLSSKGLNPGALVVFCLLWGFGGAFISLALSRVMARWMMGVKIIEGSDPNPELRHVLFTVRHLSNKAGLSTCPQVGVYENEEVNAFATGPTRSRALVAVSSGLLQKLDSDQVEGVLAHEVAHIANGDMVTMTLVQGVINSFVLFLSRLIAFFLSQSIREESRPAIQTVMTIALDIFLTILGSLAVAFYSRRREFAADAAGAKLVGRKKMVSALKGLRCSIGAENDDKAQGLASMKISGKSGGMLALFATHPPLELRIQRLTYGRVERLMKAHATQ